MLDLLKRFIREEDGLGTVEIVVIIAVLVGVALIFRKAVYSFVTTIIGNVMSTGGKAGDTAPAESYVVPSVGKD